MSAAERIRREVREIGLVTLYFLGAFLLFLTLKKLILEEYSVRVGILGTAVISALVVAKVVVVLDKTPVGDFFRSQRRFLHVLWRSLTYTAIVFVVTMGERLFDAYRETGALPDALQEVWAGEDVNHFLAMNLSVGLAFVIYNVFAEIGRHMGPGKLRRLFFGPRGAESEPT
jgi:hypothetical protein